MTAIKSSKLFSILVAAVVLAMGIILSLRTGVAVQAELQNVDLFTISRLPRTLAAMLAGTGLAIAGLVMQMIAHNRFVEPNTTGTGQGAVLGLLIGEIAFPVAPLMIRMSFAALCAMISMILFLYIAKRLPNHKNPVLLPLVGMIYAGVLDAIMNFIAYETELQQWIGVWLNGDFSGVLQGRYELLWGCAVVVLLLHLLADRLTIISMGKHASQGLGLNYRQIVNLGIVLISTMTAFIISTIGAISFLGLIVPNIVCRFTGDNLRRALPWTAWTGAVLMLGCDLFARVVNAPYEVPVSLIFGILGSAIFLFLLFIPNRT